MRIIITLFTFTLIFHPVLSPGVKGAFAVPGPVHPYLSYIDHAENCEISFQVVGGSGNDALNFLLIRKRDFT
jgi:hypothetical protein